MITHMSQLESTQEFEALLNHLKKHLGYDLTVYKRPTLLRRFEHRMQELQIKNYTDYLEYLKNHPFIGCSFIKYSLN